MNGGAIDCIADTSAIIGLLRGDPRASRRSLAEEGARLGNGNFMEL